MTPLMCDGLGRIMGTQGSAVGCLSQALRSGYVLQTEPWAAIPDTQLASVQPQASSLGVLGLPLMPTGPVCHVTSGLELSLNSTCPEVSSQSS